MYTLKLIPDAYKCMCFKIIEHHKSELNQEDTAVHKSSDSTEQNMISQEIQKTKQT